ncbi:MAG: OmpA family protein [Phycisphaerales bacterium]|nr:OmpA family protein [Phycisphaerales bacterium]
MIRMSMTLGLAAAALVLTGCSNGLKETNRMLTEENQSLRDQLEERNGALDGSSVEVREKDMQIAQLRRELDNARAMAANAQQVAVPAPSRTAFDDIDGVTGSVGAGEVTATVSSDVLFDSGKATLKPSAKKALDEVARVLNSTYSTHTIRVAGHTDTDPIKKSGHKSNYHLGFERAYAVRDYLISRGVATDRVYIASFGPIAPMATKKDSRRVDIVVVLNS